MTGGEFAAAGAASKALKAVSKAAEEDPAVKQELLDKAKERPAMDAAADAYAKRLAVKQEILLKLFMPLALMLGVSRDYFESQFSSDMAEKIKEVPEEELVPPKPSIAGPTMQALGYSLDEPNLKEMYLQLLATAVDGRRSAEAHPSFVEVIKQLSADEAALLKTVQRAAHLPVIRIKRVDQSEAEGGFVILQSHVVNFVNLEDQSPVVNPSMDVYVDNWVRLGLVAVSYDQRLTGPDMYDWAERRPEFVEARAEHQIGNVLVAYDQGVLSRTAFGLRFMAAVSE